MDQFRGWLALNSLRLWFPAGVRVVLFVLVDWILPQVTWLWWVLVIEATLAFVRYLNYWRRRERIVASFFRSSGKLRALVADDKKRFRKKVVRALIAQGFDIQPADDLKAPFAMVGQPNAVAVMLCGTDAAGLPVLVRCIQNTPGWMVTSREIKRFLAVVANQHACYGLIITTSRFTPGAKAISAAYPIKFIGGRELVALLDQLPPRKATSDNPNGHSGHPARAVLAMSETSSLDDPPRSAAISEPARDQIYPERPESRRYPATTAHTNGPENPGGFADRGGTATPFEPKEKEVDHVFPTRNPQQQDPDSGTMTTLDLVDAPPWNTPVDGDSADGSRYGTLMRQVVNQSVYRRNAFRLTGLPVNATAPQIRRRGTELCALARVGAPPPAQPGVLPTAESLTESDVQETLQALRNPDRRLVEDLFWFWPDTTGENKTNPSPPVLDAENAREHWEQLLRTHPAESPAAAVALHNLAVLTHAQALDSECDGHVDAPLWANALRWWLAVLTTDACWTHLTDRVRDLGDTRLSSQSVADLRQALPEALLSINTALLVQADTESAADRTRRSQQQRIIIDSKFPSAAVNRARMTAAEPVLALLRAACAPIRKAPPLNGAITAAAFLDRIAHPVAVLDDLLTTGHPLLEGIRDEVAMTAQDAVIEYSNRTWEPNSDPTQGPCLDLLGRIEGIAATDSVKKHIRDNRDSIRGHPGCWFCHDDERVDFHDRYTATITRPPGTKDETQPNTGRMHISRCKRCHIKHVHAQRTATVLHWLAAILGGILLTFRINIGTYPNWFVTSIIPITLWLMALLYERRTNQKILRRAAAYPPVAECIEQGWKLDGLRRRRR